MWHVQQRGVKSCSDGCCTQTTFPCPARSLLKHHLSHRRMAATSISACIDVWTAPRASRICAHTACLHISSILQYVPPGWSTRSTRLPAMWTWRPVAGAEPLKAVPVCRPCARQYTMTRSPSSVSTNSAGSTGSTEKGRVAVHNGDCDPCVATI